MSEGGVDISSSQEPIGSPLSPQNVEGAASTPRLIDHLTSIENPDVLLTKSGRISAEGRKVVDDVYSTLLQSSDNDYKHALNEVRQAKIGPAKYGTNEQTNQRFQTVLNSLRGKLVYEAHYSWAIEQFSKKLEEGVIGFDEIVKTSSIIPQTDADTASLDDLFKSYYRANNKTVYGFIREQKQALGEVNIYEEASRAEQQILKNLGSETQGIESGIGTIIEEDLKQLRFSTSKERVGFKQRIEDGLRSLAPKVLNKKVVYGAMTVITIAFLLRSSAQPIIPRLVAIETKTTAALVQAAPAGAEHVIPQFQNNGIDNLFDLEHLEDEVYGPKTNLFSDGYFEQEVDEEIPVVRPQPGETANKVEPPTSVVSSDTQEVGVEQFIKAGTLESDLAAIAEEALGKWGIYVKEIGSDTAYGINESLTFHPASTIKIPIALEFFYWIDKQGLSHQDVLKQIPRGEYRTFEQLLNDMLVNSEETATEAISQHINAQDGYNVNQILDTWGVGDISVYPRRATAAEMGKLLEDFYSGKLGLSEESKEMLLNMLRTPSRDDFSRLGAPLPQHVRDTYAHKIGTVLGDGGLYTASDMGIVDLGNGTVYVVVGLSELERESQYHDAVVTLQKVGGAALRGFSPDYYQEQLIKGESSTVYVDQEYANIGRLYNLQVVGERMDGVVLSAGETVTLSDIALGDLDEYMMGFAYGDVKDGTALGGGICGVASALAKAAENLGLPWASEARHLPSDHAPGGLYENLPNGSFSSGKDFSITNTTGQDLVINFSSNYNLSDIPSSGSWDTYIDPQTTIGKEEFTVSISLVPKGQVAEVNPVQETTQSQEAQVANMSTVATAQYKSGEYFVTTATNLDIATDHINQYFELSSLKPSAEGAFTFSYNDVMQHYEESGWTQTTGFLGAGACDIATLMYRASRDFSGEMGSDLVKIDRDQFGHDIMRNDIFTIRKVNHSPYNGMPADELAVSSVSRTNKWNSDFEIKVNSQFSNGVDVPSDLEIRFFAYLDENLNYVAEISSNYTIEELRELAGLNLRRRLPQAERFK